MKFQGKVPEDWGTIRGDCWGVDGGGQSLSCMFSLLVYLRILNYEGSVALIHRQIKQNPHLAFFFHFPLEVTRVESSNCVSQTFCAHTNTR